MAAGSGQQAAADWRAAGGGRQAWEPEQRVESSHLEPQAGTTERTGMALKALQ